MSRYGYLPGILLLTLAASLALACGASNNSQRQIESITVSPASADAQDYPSGQVPFVATGAFTLAPTSVTPLQATWAAVGPDGLTTDVTVTSNGLAQCASGASGTYTVGAWIVLLGHPPTPICNVISPFGNPCGDSVIGTAQLTCP
jgi:hypothetical protein